MAILVDGTGTGKRAKININNKLDVAATTHSEEHDIAVTEAQAYFANTADTADTLTLATGNTYNLLYIKNTSTTKLLIVEKIIASFDTAGIVFKFIKNHTLGTASANNAHEPVNVNFASNNTADCVAHNWDETGTSGIGGLTGGTTIKTFNLVAGPTFFPVDGFMVLGPNNAITLTATNNTGGNVEGECGIRFYYDSEEAL